MRPWFIIMIAVALLAGIAVTATLLLTQAKTITVHGNVIDQVRPDRGVAAATINGDGTTAKADATGAFKLAGVPENAVLSVSAPYYRTNTVPASAKHLTIRLTPLPVTVTVTSAMTGAPVRADISAPAGKPEPYTITAGGVTRLYAAGPGETLTVTANGYRPAHPVIGRGQTLTVALEPTARAVEQQFGRWASHAQYSKIVDWVLRPATGYTYESMTPAEEARVTSGLRDVVDYGTVRLVSGTQASVEVFIDKPGSSIGPRSLAQMFGHAAPVRIAGVPAWHGGPDSYGTCITAVRLHRLELQVIANSTAQTDQIMTKILTTMLGPGPSTGT